MIFAGHWRSPVILGVALIAGSAHAAPGDGFEGRWEIATARLAPWADPQQAGGTEEERRLAGQTVVIGRDFVTGPSPLGCRHARFTSHSDTPDLLFEGGLAEGPVGRRRDARSEARALGMTTATVRTLETSCSEVAYHRMSPMTLMFGLNNRIYILHPAPHR